MEQHQHYANMSILFDHLGRIGSIGDRASFDDIFGNVLGIRTGVGTYARLTNLTSAFLGNGGNVDYLSGDRDTGANMTVRAGLGFKRDNSDPEGTDQPRELPIQIDIDFNFTLSASEAQDRIDSVFARPEFTDGNTTSVPIIDPVTDVITSENRDIDKIYGAEIVIQEGVAGSGAPAPPGTFLESDRICNITVLTGSGGIDPSEIADLRERYRIGVGLLAGLAEDVDVVPTIRGGTQVQAALTGLDAAVAAIVFPYTEGHLFGMELTRTAVDRITISVGSCRDRANTLNLDLVSTLQKQIDTDWAPGDTLGGFPETELGGPVQNNTWYHVFLIEDGAGTIDAGFDTDINAVNLLTESGYTKYRRLGAVLTDGSANIFEFVQRGDFFAWTLLIEDVSINMSLGGTLQPVRVPKDIEVEVILNISYNRGSGTNVGYLSSPLITHQAPGVNGPVHGVIYGDNNQGHAIGQVRILTNTSQQIREATDNSSSTIEWSTSGWYDRRDRAA